MTHRADRIEDFRLLTGAGRFTADLIPPDTLHAAFLRAPTAHARIAALDLSRARATADVVAVFDGAAMTAMGVGTIPEMSQVPSSPGGTFIATPWPVLAADRVRHVGQPVALVVAQSPSAALDGAEQIVADYDSLAAVNGSGAALAADAPQVWDHAAGNIASRYCVGDRAASETALANAAHRVSVDLVSPRIAASPVEPRAAIAWYDTDAGQYVLRVPSQGVGILHRHLVRVLGIAPDALRILSDDVGGAFGAKIWCYPEYPALLAAARAVGRPVSWIATRSESMQSDTQGRDHRVVATLGLDRRGRILALDVDATVNIGAFHTGNGAFVNSVNFVRSLVGPYRTPHIAARVTCAFSNTVPIGPYRGAGRPEGTFVIERLLDTAAATCGFDKVRLRETNLIPSAAMPYKTPVGHVYDSGDFAAVLQQAIAAGDRAGFAARRRGARKRKRISGWGLACYVEPAGGPAPETVCLRLTADERVMVDMGGHPIGTAHETVFCALTAQRLGLPAECCTVRQGDSNRHRDGAGSVASRSAVANGTAIVVATDRLIEKARRLAALLLQLDAADLIYSNGAVHTADNSRALSLFAIDRRSRELAGLPAELAGGLDQRADIDAQPTYPNGCHVAEVEIDSETGLVTIVNYVAVDDCGNVLNEAVVEGQIHGGIVQGIGQALIEQIVYDTGAQLVTGSYMDYGVPRAHMLPAFRVVAAPTACTTNPLGLKGAGESGTTGALSAIVSAVGDALQQAGVDHLDLPLSPARIWQAINAASTRT